MSNSIIEETSFNALKRREQELQLSQTEKNHLFRKGKVGEAKSMLTPELEARVNDWIKENSEELHIDIRYK